MNVLQPAHSSICADALGTQPSAAPDPVDAGRLCSQAEAEDDARAILVFLRNGLATRDIDPAQPVWIIDLAPGDGERAWLVLRYLVEHVSRAPMLRYLACCASQAQREALADLAVLHAEAQAGRLVIAGEDEGFRRYDLCNPVVVLAHGAFASREQAIYACHYGELLEGTRQPDGQMGWAPLQERDGLCSLLAAYCRAINSAPLSLPVGGMRSMQALLAATGGRLLMRASDPGAMDLVQIRQGMLGTDAAPRRVNFEALARWHRSQGATVHQSQHNDQGRVLQLAVHDKRGGQLRAALPDMLELPHPDVRAAALSVMQGTEAGPTHYAAWIEQVHADPRLVPPSADTLLALASEVQGTALGHWRELLCRLSDNYYPGWRDLSLRCKLASLAMHLEDWGQARRSLQQALLDHGDHALCWHMLAECQARTGELDAALSSLGHACQALPEDSSAQGALTRAIDHVEQRLARQQTCAAFSPALSCDGLLRLMLLDETHAAEFFYQYRDPQIGMMTRLPAFEDVDKLSAWIAERCTDPTRTEFAIMHPAYGFAGVISAHQLGESAFCHFWLGVDFQGQGLAVPALQCFCAQLHRLGVRRVFTAAYPDNFRSQQVLLRAGFLVLPERALPPEENMIFFCLELDEAHSTAANNGAALCDYCVCSGGVFEFTDPEAMGVVS